MIRHAHFYWGNTTLPWLQSISIRSFVAHHPGWKVNLWRPVCQAKYDTVGDHFEDVRRAGVIVDELLDVEALTGAMLQGYPADNAWMQTAWSDAARLWLLHEYGGLWSDCDVLYFRNVEGTSIDGGDISLYWESDDSVYNSIISAKPGAEALKKLLQKQREISPAFQPPGGQSPFGAGLFASTFSTTTMPGFKCADPREFHFPPLSVAYHYRTARVAWASIGPDNWRERCKDIPDLVPSIEKVLACL